MKTALVYCRVSTKGQEDDGTSLDSQESACIAHAQSLGYSIGRITREVYPGAELHDRPLLARDRAELKQFAALICYSTDRLARNPIHVGMIAEECERAGTELIFVTEPLDSSPEGALILYVRGFAAQLEREKIRERCVRGKRTRALSGKLHNAGPELYGYRRDKEAGVRRICEPEARVVREIFQLVIDGVGVRGIASRLNREGIPAPAAGKRTYTDGRSPRWGKSGIRRLLRHEAYKGEAVAWKWQRDKRKRVKARAPEERINLPAGLVPPIVSPEAWSLAQTRLDSNTGEKKRNETRPYLLRGRVSCSVCGARMYADAGSYRCSSREKATGRCGGSQVPASACEKWAWEIVTTAIKNPTLIEQQWRRMRSDNGQAKLQAEVKKLRKEVERLERGQQRLVRTLRDSEDGLSDLIHAELRQAEAEKGRVKLALAEIESRLSPRAQSDLWFTDLKTICKRAEVRLPGFGFEERCQTLQAWGVGISANGKNWELRMRPPGGVMSTSYSGSAQASGWITFSNAA